MKDLFDEKDIVENETQQVFLQGVNAGIHYMMDKIERQYKMVNQFRQMAVCIG